jgi:hypothetical protein
MDAPSAAPSIDPKDLAQEICDTLNKIHAAGLVLRTRTDHQSVLSEPGHTIGWVDVATLEYNDEDDEWFVAA